jgi:hypothetical protein
MEPLSSATAQVSIENLTLLLDNLTIYAFMASEDILFSLFVYCSDTQHHIVVHKKGS